MCYTSMSQLSLVTLEALLDAGALEATIELWTNRTGDAAVCREAAKLLITLCSSDDVGAGTRKLVVGSHGSVKTVTESMALWGDDLGVQHGCCQVICVLCSGHAVFAEPCRWASEDFASTGAIPLVVKALLKFGSRTDTDFFHVGCAALRFLTYTHKKHKRAARKAGAKFAWL